MCSVSIDPTVPRQRLLFDEDWRFLQKDPPNATPALTYAKMRPRLLAFSQDLEAIPHRSRAPIPAEEPLTQVDYARSDFDDSAWQPVTLPHDWAIGQPFQPELPGNTGKLLWAGIGWYRKTFRVTASELNDRRAEIEIDGAMSHSLVWLNGHFIGGWVYGYTSFRVDLTPHLRPDTENVLLIRLNNPPASSRWYPGCGLYRHVWLHLTPSLRFEPNGVFISTPSVDSSQAQVQVDMVIEAGDDSVAECTLITTLHELDDKGVPRPEPAVTAPPLLLTPGPQPRRRACRSQTLSVNQPKLWDIDSPQRYVAITRLHLGDTLIDEVATPFGIRQFSFTAADGFHLNGRRVQIRGVCQHHDLGALGAAFDVSAAFRQLRILREMGCNAIRTAHNPPAPELLDLCDRLGFIVMNEAFDCWRIGKRENDYSQFFDDWHERDVRAWVRRDRNHPCVVLWSIGNEVMEQWETDGWPVATRLAGIVREEDRTRPVTMGISVEPSAEQGFHTAVDVIGYNYKPWAYQALHSRHPQIPTYGSETSSCVSSRDTYVFPVSDDKAAGAADYQVSSYDLSAPPWAWPPDREFAGLDDSPAAAGEFVWTGFDYLGEPTPYNDDTTNLLNFSDPAERERTERQMEAFGRVPLPSRSSYFGFVDLAGFPKDRYYLYHARWRPDSPVAHLLPHWNWPDRVGQTTPVHLYTNGDEAELFLNNKSLGTRRRGSRDYRLRWDDVVYEPGELYVLVTRNGQPWAEATRRTTGAVAVLHLTLEPTPPAHLIPFANRPALRFVNIEVVDHTGAIVPTADIPLHLDVSGPARLVAADNGDPTPHRAFPSPELKAFRGRALAMIQPLGGGSDRIQLSVTSTGLPPVQIQL